jgi:uncharacterized Zn finger protein
MPPWGGDWWYYPRYTPTTPKAVKDGIKTKSRHGDIGETWWSKRWLDVLHSFGMGARLDRGKSYARRGQVVSIDIGKGVVKAKVQGSRPSPYAITMKLRPLTDGQWAKVTEALASRAAFAAGLLAGEMPREVEQVFAQAGVPLFPQRKGDLETDCSCPDWANPCKHLAAVHFILAERFDTDPFLIFHLRGRTRDEVVKALREARGRLGAPAMRGAAVTGTGAAEDQGGPPPSKGRRARAPRVAPGAPPAATAGAAGGGPAGPAGGAARGFGADAGAGAGAGPPVGGGAAGDIAGFWAAGAGVGTAPLGLDAPVGEGAVLAALGPSPLTVGGEDLRNVLARAYAAAGMAARERLLGGGDDDIGGDGGDGGGRPGDGDAGAIRSRTSQERRP